MTFRVLLENCREVWSSCTSNSLASSCRIAARCCFQVCTSTMDGNLKLHDHCLFSVQNHNYAASNTSPLREPLQECRKHLTSYLTSLKPPCPLCHNPQGPRRPHKRGPRETSVPGKFNWGNQVPYCSTVVICGSL